MTASVVITGLGGVGSYGAGVDGLAEALRTSTLHTSEVDRSAGYHIDGGARTAALVGGLDVSAWVTPGAARRMSPPSKLAVAAARMALADAQPGSAEAPSSTAVVLATAFGPASFTEKLLRSVLVDGPETASPFLFTECVANAPAAQVAISCRARGPNLTFAQREAGPLLALGRGARDVASGSVGCALVGAVEECSPLVHAILDRFRALAQPDASGREVPRPLDRRRTGFIVGEGAAVLVLEREDEAGARGARVRARVRTAASAFDPTASRVSWGQGHPALARALRRMLDRAHLAPSDIDVIASGASGSVAGDRLEALTLRAAWGETPLPPVLAPKAITAEYGGAFLAAAVLAAEGAAFGPVPGFDEPDPALGLVPVARDARPQGCRVLVSGLAAGGAAAWVVLERP